MSPASARQVTPPDATVRGAPAALLTARQASEYLQIPVATLAVWRCTGRVELPFVKAGRAVRYRREDLENFLRAGNCTAANEPKGAREVARPAARRRLDEFRAAGKPLICERCDTPVLEAEACVVSQLELANLEGPRDPHDWHCYCGSCQRFLSGLTSAQEQRKELRMTPAPFRSAASLH
jgi:excisionase family DNA binding protein